MEGIFRQNSSNYVEDYIYWRKISQVIAKKMYFFTKISKSREVHLKIIVFFTVKAIVLTLEYKTTDTWKYEAQFCRLP